MKPTDATHRRFGIAAAACLLALAALSGPARAQDNYYWGADTLGDEDWSYCSDRVYRPICPGGYEPLDFYIAKLGTGWCTLEEHWQDVMEDGASNECGSWTDPEFWGSCDVREVDDDLVIDNCRVRDLPVSPNERHTYWYLRGPGDCDGDPVSYSLGRQPADELQWCDDVVRARMGLAPAPPEAVYGCIQAHGYLDTYQTAVDLVVPDDGTHYRADYDSNFAGDTLFVDIEQRGCNWDSPATAQNRLVMSGFLHGLKAGIEVRGLDKNIGIYTRPSAWTAIIGADFDDFPTGGVVVWQARYHHGSDPALDTITQFAPVIFDGELYRLGMWWPVIWQFAESSGDFNVALQDGANRFWPLTSGTTFEIQIDAASDDAGPEPGGCIFSTTWNEIYFGECDNGDDIISGFRFPDVPIARYTEITSAYIEFTVDGRYTNPLSLELYGEYAGNAQPFSGTDRPEGRPPTGESVTWIIPASDVWELGQTRHSPDLTEIVQQIVNRPDWDAYNALAIIVENVGPANSLHRRVIGHERPEWYPGSEYAARLVITHEGDEPPRPTATATSTPTSTPTSTSTSTPTSTSTSTPTATPTPTPQPCLCAWLCINTKSQQAVGSSAATVSRLAPIARGIRKALDTTSLLFELRDEWMAGTPEGQRYIGLYESFSPEIATILLADPGLRDEGIATVERFVPAISALLSGAGGSVAISAEDMAAVDDFLAALSAVASPQLEDVIRLERERRPLGLFVGRTVDEAWAYFNGYELAWQPPLGGGQPITVKRGRKLPVKFRLTTLDGEPVLDESVVLWLQTPTGAMVFGPIGLSNNPNTGLKYNGNGTYHHNLDTESLTPGPYTLVVDYNSSTGEPATHELEVR